MPEGDKAHHLLIRIQQKDFTALEELVDIYGKPFLGYALNRLKTIDKENWRANRQKNIEDADWLVTLVFFRIFNKVDLYKPEKSKGKGEPWLWRICRRVVSSQLEVIKNERRREQRMREIPLDKKYEDELAAPGADPSEVFERTERMQAFTTAWNSLPKEDIDDLLQRLSEAEAVGGNPPRALRVAREKVEEQVEARFLQLYKELLYTSFFSFRPKGKPNDEDTKTEP